VVSAFNKAIEHAVRYSKEPSEDFVDQVMNLISGTQSMRVTKEGGDIQARAGAEEEQETTAE